MASDRVQLTHDQITARRWGQTALGVQQRDFMLRTVRARADISPELCNGRTQGELATAPNTVIVEGNLGMVPQTRIPNQNW